MFYPNQKLIEVHRKKIKSNGGKRYLIAYHDDIIAAMNELSKSTFIVYIYMLFNKDGFKLEYSPASIANATGISAESARKAFNELKEKKYIKMNDKSHYEFYESGDVSSVIEIKRKSFIDNETGEEYMLSYDELKEKVGEYTARSMWEE